MRIIPPVVVAIVVIAVAAVAGLAVAPRLAPGPLLAPAQPAGGEAALEALDRYLSAWNASDTAAFAATLLYPHTRQSAAPSGNGLWDSAGEYAAALDFAQLAASGWARSHWTARTVVQAGSDKVHVAGGARRVDADGRPIATLQTLYVMAERAGGWGVQARFSAGPPVDPATAAASRQAAAEVADAYLDAVNRRDGPAFAATLNYPHYRVARGEVQVWEQASEIAATNFEGLARTGWVRSAWDSVRPVQVSRDAVNLALVLSRYNAAGERILQFDTLYLVTRQEGRWGIRARSSFAPR